MVKIQPYTHKDFFKEIPDLENKTFLDVGAGINCLFGMMYLSQIYDKMARTQEELDEKAYSESNKFRKNVVAVDLKYKGRLNSMLPEVSVRADARKLPFANESFDIVGIGWLLDYFLRDDLGLEQVINESTRVLKSDGYLIGDVLLHPPTSIKDRLLPLKLLMKKPDYYKQMENYKKKVRDNEVEFLKEGIGFNANQIGNNLTFYFVAQKR